MTSLYYNKSTLVASSTSYLLYSTDWHLSLTYTTLQRTLRRT